MLFCLHFPLFGIGPIFFLHAFSGTGFLSILAGAQCSLRSSPCSQVSTPVRRPVDFRLHFQRSSSSFKGTIFRLKGHPFGGSPFLTQIWGPHIFGAPYFEKNLKETTTGLSMEMKGRHTHLELCSNNPLWVPFPRPRGGDLNNTRPYALAKKGIHGSLRRS